MEIDEKLKEIGNYFKQKVIDGSFEFVSSGAHTAEIIIDGKYHFNLWIANDPKGNFDFYDSYFLVNNSTEFMRFKTQKERMAGWKQIKPHVIKYKKTVLKREKQKEFNRLKKELERLNNN